jgi:hypothetical protein
MSSNVSSDADNSSLDDSSSTSEALPARRRLITSQRVPPVRFVNSPTAESIDVGAYLNTDVDEPAFTRKVFEGKDEEQPALADRAGPQLVGAHNVMD